MPDINGRFWQKHDKLESCDHGTLQIKIKASQLSSVQNAATLPQQQSGLSEL